MANQPNNEKQKAPSSEALIQKTGEDQVVGGSSAAGFMDSLKNRYQKIKDSWNTPAKDMANQPNNEKQQAPSSAATIQETGEDQVVAAPPAAGFMDSLENRYKKIKEHAETYPYVWGSYILVYGGFGLWFAYRYRKLLRTEDRVRALQARLREMVEKDKIVEAEKSSNSAKVVEKGSTSSEIPSK